MNKGGLPTSHAVHIIQFSLTLFSWCEWQRTDVIASFTLLVKVRVSHLCSENDCVSQRKVEDKEENEKKKGKNTLKTPKYFAH